jgi:hypothetical protein
MQELQNLPASSTFCCQQKTFDQELAAEVSEHCRSLNVKVWQNSHVQVDPSAISNLRAGNDK